MVTPSPVRRPSVRLRPAAAEAGHWRSCAEPSRVARSFRIASRCNAMQCKALSICAQPSPQVHANNVAVASAVRRYSWDPAARCLWPAATPWTMRRPPDAPRLSNIKYCLSNLFNLFNIQYCLLLWWPARRERWRVTHLALARRFSSSNLYVVAIFDHILLTRNWNERDAVRAWLASDIYKNGKIEDYLYTVYL